VTFHTLLTICLKYEMLVYGVLIKCGYFLWRFSVGEGRKLAL